MVAARLRPVRDDDVAVGRRGPRPELVREAQVVADEETDAQALDLDGEERVARVVVLVLAAVGERVDLVVVVQRTLGAGEHEPVDGPGAPGACTGIDAHTQTSWRCACSRRNCVLGPSSGSAMRSLAIEKPVENISVSATRRAPLPRPARSSAPHAPGSCRAAPTRCRAGHLRFSSVGSHGARAFRRATASSSTSGRLQHAHRTSGAPAALSS